MAKEGTRGVRTLRIEKIAELLRLLGDPSRSALLFLLGKERQGFYVHEVATSLGLTHSAASHQLGVLELHGIVMGVREGKLVRYKLAASPTARKALRILRAAER